MASSLGAAGRLAPQQCARTALSNKRQRRSAASRLARRQNVTVAAEGNGSNGSNGNLAWDTLSVDELQEWEVGARACAWGRRSASLHLPRQAPVCCAPPGRPALTRNAYCLQVTGPPTPLLDTINYPVHLKNLGLNDLKKLCKELRAGEQPSSLPTSCPPALLRVCLPRRLRAAGLAAGPHALCPAGHRSMLPRRRRSRLSSSSCPSISLPHLLAPPATRHLCRPDPQGCQDRRAPGQQPGRGGAHPGVALCVQHPRGQDHL